MSFWGKLGKIALKVAPIAAAFIPGVGPLASMAIGGLTGAASTKASGGSWKQALLSGGIGAGAGAVGGGALKGIGPSSGTLAKIGAGAVGKAAGTGVKGAIGASLGALGKQALSSAIAGGPKAASSPVASPTGLGPSSVPTGRTAVSTGVMPRGGYKYNENPLNQVNQSNPNLAQSIFQGKQEAIRNQPWRAGYDIKTQGPDDTVVTSRMPSIFSGSDPRRKKKPFSYAVPEPATT